MKNTSLHEADKTWKHKVFKDSSVSQHQISENQFEESNMKLYTPDFTC